ncbi:hypothetical protein PybrP1_001763 [[Pythium] brassicae (nom. inval.)]|nr:hypothetical protein PybrP1_001763 [[Pythium] brassicae (nom. inval.)]
MESVDPPSASLSPAVASPIAVALAVGALLFALALYTLRPPPPSATIARSDTLVSTGDDDPQRQRVRAYVDHHVALHDVALFASSKAAGAHACALLEAVVSPHHRERVTFVDLGSVAHGKKILDVLRSLRSEEAPGDDDAERNAFLFVRGVFVGDYAHVRRLLVEGALEETLAASVECDFSTIRVDLHSPAGFFVLSPLRCFQRVRDEQVAAAAAATTTAVDPLLETRPIDIVEELLDAATCEAAVEAAARLLPRVLLAERARNPARRSKLLVCHDMQGGYLSDRFTQGSADFDAYRFYQWDLVDLFVYFGHHLVCIPPAGWIAAGHRNGTRVLGAVVMEGSSGAALSAQIFSDKASAEICAAKLAAIASLYGFDGYLVNVENDVAEALVPNVFAFLSALRAALAASNPEAQVVWYASVARSGKRKHQARLDADSVPFFACVDGLFTDYGWTPDDANFSAALDLDRRFDVYMGVDVFGRHDTLGGGKLDSGVALRAAWNAGVSAALFAPGWTHECLRHEAGEDFVASEHRFWSMIRSNWKPRSPSFSALGGRDSLYSAFNVGRGANVWVDGCPSVAACGGDRSAKWSNLLEMDQQPVASLHAGVTVQTRESEVHAVVSHDAAFQGGACVSIAGTMGGKDKAYVKLFDVDIELSARHVTEISFTTAQPVSGSVALLVLTVCPGLDRAAHQVILRSDAGESDAPECSALSPLVGSSPGKHFYAPVWTREYPTRDSVDSDSRQALVWIKKAYRVGGMLWDQRHIVEIGVLCTKKKPAMRDFHAYVGEVCVAGRASVRSKVSVGILAAEPVRCVNAVVRAFQRVDAESVAFQVEWGFSPAAEQSTEPAQYVLVYLCERRVLLGKSFGTSLRVARCPWGRAQPGEPSASSPQMLELELVSVSWCGTRASDAGVCRLVLNEDSG